MGSKPSNHFQMDRPESGGADRREERENSGLLEQAKRDFAESEKAKHESRPRQTPQSPDESKQPTEDGEDEKP